MRVQLCTCDLLAYCCFVHVNNASMSRLHTDVVEIVTI